MMISQKFLIDNQLVLIIRMPQVAVGGQRPQILAALRFGMKRGLDLCRNVPCIHIIYDISERGKVVTHLIVAVHSVIDGDKADAHLREADFTDMDKTTN